MYTLLSVRRYKKNQWLFFHLCSTKYMGK